MILTRTGEHFSFDAPYRFDIRAIAASLAKLCRFCGHTLDFYSVAQHCVHVSEIVPAEFALDGLLHDATEAYLGDMSSPLKRLCVDYQAIEVRLEVAVRAQFNLSTIQPPEVRHADLVMLLTEKRDLMPDPIDQQRPAWPAGIAPLGMTVRAWSWQEAERRFLDRFAELTE